MPGVIRPYTLVDVLATINGQNSQSASATVGANATGFGVVAEADESIPATSIGDAAVSFATVPAGWDQQSWGADQWG